LIFHTGGFYVKTPALLVTINKFWKCLKTCIFPISKWILHTLWVCAT